MALWFLARGIYAKNKNSVNVLEEKQVRLAVLIDADTASVKTIKSILEECKKFGEPIYRRVYGNFVGNGSKWNSIANKYAIKVCKQFAFIKGNATDGFMIIDAMDLLYTGRYDGFCIVSSDSDFTALAIRLKEQGMAVYGFGEKKTPEAFRNVCSQFIYIENLLSQEDGQQKDTQVVVSEPVSTKQEKCGELKNEVTELPINTIKKVFDWFDDEWVRITAFASTWKRLQVDVDPRNWGCKKFTDLIKKYNDIFDYKMQKEKNEKTGSIHEHMYVRLKR